MSAAEKHFKEWCIKPENVLKSTYDWAQEYAELYASHEREKMLNVIKLYKEYSEFLGKHLEAHASFTFARTGYYPNEEAIKKGQEYRDKIEALLNHLKQNR